MEQEMHRSGKHLVPIVRANSFEEWRLAVQAGVAVVAVRRDVHVRLPLRTRVLCAGVDVGMTSAGPRAAAGLVFSGRPDVGPRAILPMLFRRAPVVEKPAAATHERTMRKAATSKQEPERPLVRILLLGEAGATRCPEKRCLMVRRIIRLPEVMRTTGLSRSMIFELQKRREFPRSVKIGPRAMGWYEHEVQHFIKTRPRFGGDRPER